MARYVFKKQDLEPLRPWLDDPVARQVLKSTLPLKRPRAEQPPTEELIELPFKVRSRDQPDGVPLHDVLEALRAELPSVEGLSVQGDKVLLKHQSAPREQDKEKLRRLLQEPRRLMALATPAKPAALTVPQVADLEKVLRDDGTPDAEWLKAFRRYAVAHLIPAEKGSK